MLFSVQVRLESRGLGSKAVRGEGGRCRVGLPMSKGSQLLRRSAAVVVVEILEVYGQVAHGRTSMHVRQRVGHWCVVAVSSGQTITAAAKGRNRAITDVQVGDVLLVVTT